MAYINGKEILFSSVIGTGSCGNVYYQTVDNGIYINAPYSADYDINYYLCKKGPNSIFDFSRIGKVAKGSPVSNVIEPTSFLVASSGDWHAPYVVKANSNGDGDNPSSYYFTGGNHSYNNSATGAATGRTDNLKMYADGNELLANDSGYCKQVKIEWDNYIQGYNTTKADGTGREVLREHITMIFDGIKWSTETTLYPLEKITVMKWYGLQFFTLNYPYVAYINGADSVIKEKVNDSESGNAVTNAMRWFGLEDTAIVEVDTLYDLGTRKFASGTTKSFFAASAYSKAYGSIIEGATLSSGGAYSLRGSYTFKHEIQQIPKLLEETLLNLNRTQGTNWWGEDNYINPTNSYSVAIPSEDPCGIANLTQNSITVTDNGNNRGVTFPFVIYSTSQGIDRRGKTYELTWSEDGGTNTYFNIVGNFGGWKVVGLDSSGAATISISEDGKTLTRNGYDYVHTTEIGYIGFFFGAKSGTTVSYTNVVLKEV